MAVTRITAFPPTEAKASAEIDAVMVPPPGASTATSAGSPASINAALSTTAAEVTPESDTTLGTVAIVSPSARPMDKTSSATRFSASSFACSTCAAGTGVVVVVVGGTSVGGNDVLEDVEVVVAVFEVVVDELVDEDVVVGVLDVEVDEDEVDNVLDEEWVEGEVLEDDVVVDMVLLVEVLDVLGEVEVEEVYDVGELVLLRDVVDVDTDVLEEEEVEVELVVV
mmetsp:Transcript_31718/g.72379  ORF Transcript_31718/g.72379 Transcript_31718/m.72379 type:complete len:224 (+) Transcript_31718:2395-3066(+)